MGWDGMSYRVSHIISSSDCIKKWSKESLRESLFSLFVVFSLIDAKFNCLSLKIVIIKESEGSHRITLNMNTIFLLIEGNK